MSSASDIPLPSSPRGETLQSGPRTEPAKIFSRATKPDGTEVGRGVADFGSGKDGKMSNAAAIAFLDRLYKMIAADENARVSDLEPHEQEAFRGAVYSYLALNTGAINSVDGFGTAQESETFLHFGDKKIRAADIRIEFGSEAYRFMRARATQIATTLLLQISRARDPSGRFPLAEEMVADLMVVASRRGLFEYPHLAFVGAEFTAGITIRQRAIVSEAAANVLGGRSNTREDARTRTMAAAHGSN